jgi:hypothetical protein
MSFESFEVSLQQLIGVFINVKNYSTEVDGDGLIHVLIRFECLEKRG